MLSWEAIVVGAGLGFSLAAPPGPIIAQLAFETARGRPWLGFRVGLGATTADMTFFVLTFFGVLHVLPDKRVLGFMAVGGALLMLYFARGAWRSARRPFEPVGRALTGFPGGYLIAALSPFNLAWWLTSGATFLAIYGGGLALSFFLTIVATVVAYVFLVRFGSSRVARFETYVSYASALFLAGFALYLVKHALDLLA